MKDTVPLAPLERWAWFNLIVFAIAVVLYLMAVPFFEWRLHLNLAISLQRASGSFGVLGLWGVGQMGFGSLWGYNNTNSTYFFDRRRHTKVKLDEREIYISHRAAMIGIVLFWQVFVFLSMGVWAYLSYVRHQATVPVDFLPFLVGLGGVVFWVTQSIAILVQYKRSAGDDTL
jgi:hypothetical protein